MLKNAGFINIEKIRNDPLNSIWIASKPKREIDEIKTNMELNLNYNIEKKSNTYKNNLYAF